MPPLASAQAPDGSYSRDTSRTNLATAEISEASHLVFEGAMFTRGAVAECGADLNPQLPGGDHRTAGTEGLTLRIQGDGQLFACVVTTGESWRARRRGVSGRDGTGWAAGRDGAGVSAWRVFGRRVLFCWMHRPTAC